MTQNVVGSAHGGLLFLNGPLAGRTVTLDKPDVRFGSEQSHNDITIDDASIMPQHIRLTSYTGDIWLQSFNPQCYVAINGTPTQSTILHEGDEITLGNAGIRARFWTDRQTQVRSHAQEVKTSPPLTARQLALKSAAYTETTRYLCAAGLQDETFRNYVFKHIVNEEYKAIGDIYGADLLPIVRSCLQGQRRAFYRDIILAIGLLIYLGPVIFYLFFLNTQTPGNGLIAIGLIGIVLVSIFFLAIGYTISIFIAFVLKQFLAPLRRWSLYTLATLIFVITSIWLWPAAFFAWIVVSVETWIRLYGANAMTLVKERFNPATVGLPLEPALKEKLEKINQSGNVVVYSGYKPFTGTGINIEGWSFALDITKAKRKLGETLPPQDFTSSELYDHVTEAIKALEINTLGLNDVYMEDRLYVNGQEIRNDQRFLPNPYARPVYQVDQKTVQQYVEEISQDIRYYKCLRIVSWKGELIFSIFMRFIKIGKNLFLEADYQLLPPLQEEYYAIDQSNSSFTPSKLWSVITKSFLPSAKLLLTSPYRVGMILFNEPIVRSRQEKIRMQIDENPAFDYGASTSLRQEASSEYYRRYFQRLDREMYLKIIERQFLESIVTFLDARNIDTNDLKARQEMILNNGIILTGGSFTAGNVQVGAQSQMTTQTMPNNFATESTVPTA